MPGRRDDREPVLSRSSARWSAAARCFEFQPLSQDDIKALLRRALADKRARPGRTTTCGCTDDALEFLAEVSDGDARRALGALEIGVLSTRRASRLQFTRDLAEESVQRKAIEYDPTGDAHYDAASALIKSIRGSDPDAALYWLARMLEAGEDVRFLARRLVILASEDVGNADPHALPLAVGRDAGLRVRRPARVPAHRSPQAVTYLACAPKSNAATVAIGEARRRRPRRPAAAGAGPPARLPLRRRQAARPRRRLRIRPRRRRRLGRPGLPRRREDVLRAD